MRIFLQLINDVSIKTSFQFSLLFFSSHSEIKLFGNHRRALLAITKLANQLTLRQSAFFFDWLSLSHKKLYNILNFLGYFETDDFYKKNSCKKRTRTNLQKEIKNGNKHTTIDPTRKP